MVRRVFVHQQHLLCTEALARALPGVESGAAAVGGVVTHVRLPRPLEETLGWLAAFEPPVALLCGRRCTGVARTAIVQQRASLD